jgi:hypothetical protein
MSGDELGSFLSVRNVVTFSEQRRFDVTTLPADMQRVYGHLCADFGDEYALVWVFTVRTSVELQYTFRFLYT